MAIVVALSLTALLVIAAMVLDFGLVRLDRQELKSDADTAAMAGIAAGDGGTGEVYTYRAVCGALANLKAEGAFDGLPDDFCANLGTNASVVCSATDLSTHALYDHTISAGGATYHVTIQSPYVLDSASWTDETRQSLAGDQSAMDGCDQLGVEVRSSRQPGLGSLATSSKLTFKIRSASRAIITGSGELAPALLILERTKCSALTVGSASNGNVIVKGLGITPGSIHLDSAATGSDCGSGSNQQLVQGKHSDGIVAYGSTSPTGTSGIMSSVASLTKPANIVYDLLANAYGTTAVSGTGSVKNPVVGRALVGRTPVDKRYRVAVRTAITADGIWGNAPPVGQTWTTTGCSPTAAQLAQTGNLWINCTSNSGITLGTVTVNAANIYFNGFVKGGKISMPNAQRVYVSNTTAAGATINSNAISLTNGDGFCVRAATCAASPGCSTAATPSRARVYVRQGTLGVGGGMLRLCNTTVIALGGNTTNGCVPATNGTAPSDFPCGGSNPGNSVVDVTGQGAMDWTAPNQYAGAIPAANQTAAWNNFEDLAMWSESAGQYRFTGGGAMSTVGVYMIPNGSPVKVGGGSNQALSNTQYFARTFQTGGSGTLTLTTDPNNVVTIPSISGFVLVR